MEREKERYSSNSGTGHISRVKNYGKSSTTVLREHLTAEHNISEVHDGSSKKMVQSTLILQKKLENFQPSSTQYDFNRDLAIWASLDLEPFMFSEKPGFKYFFEKNFPTMALPTRGTMSRGALYDVYDAIQMKVKEELQSQKGGAICIMMDGWTDKYKRNPYLGLRIAYVDNDWLYKVITLSLKVLPKHTATNMSAHIRQELADYGLEISGNAIQIFTTHDGAANMVKTSQLLRSSHFQHCVAHSLHLLLMNDGVNKVPELVDLLQRCKLAVVKLDTKGYIVDNERAKCNDREAMNVLADRFAAVSAVLQADDELSLDTSASDSDSTTAISDNIDDGNK